MATDPDTSLSPNLLSEPLPAEIAQALAGGLGDFSLRELLSLMLTSLGHAERQKYLARTPADKGNGAYRRSLKIGSIPIDLAVPRTRSGSFRPTILPPPYQRDYPEQTHALLPPTPTKQTSAHGRSFSRSIRVSLSSFACSHPSLSTTSSILRGDTLCLGIPSKFEATEKQPNRPPLRRLGYAIYLMGSYTA
ncbi:MAG: transposase [Acidobacteria bacterium]|nr:transposase [Acidobacteriota bacterium]